MSCHSPELARRLSELAAGSDPTERALLEHLHDCETCAREHTQRLRWFASWDRSEPSSAAIARLRSRAASNPQRAGTPRLAVGYAAAALLATGLASATGYLWQRASQPPELISAQPAASTTLADHQPGSAARSGPATPVAAAPQLPESSSVATKGSSKELASPRSAPRSISSAQTAETWSEAATALRQGDSARASDALGELSRSRDAATRDAARLALAELWLSQGDSKKAGPVLESLASRGATPLIRRRARELLAH